MHVDLIPKRFRRLWYCLPTLFYVFRIHIYYSLQMQLYIDYSKVINTLFELHMFNYRRKEWTNYPEQWILCKSIFWTGAQRMGRRDMAAAKTLCACVALFCSLLAGLCRRKSALEQKPPRRSTLIRSRTMIFAIIKCYNEEDDNRWLMEPVNKAIRRAAKQTGKSVSYVFENITSQRSTKCTLENKQWM
jgi:hypothetical protein